MDLDQVPSPWQNKPVHLNIVTPGRNLIKIQLIAYRQTPSSMWPCHFSTHCQVYVYPEFLTVLSDYEVRSNTCVVSVFHHLFVCVTLISHRSEFPAAGNTTRRLVLMTIPRILDILILQDKTLFGALEASNIVCWLVNQPIAKLDLFKSPDCRWICETYVEYCYRNSATVRRLVQSPTLQSTISCGVHSDSRGKGIRVSPAWPYSDWIRLGVYNWNTAKVCHSRNSSRSSQVNLLVNYSASDQKVS